MKQIDELCAPRPKKANKIPFIKVSYPAKDTKKQIQKPKAKTPITVRCLKCRQKRLVTTQYLQRCKDEGWQERFLCYQFRLKSVTCFQSDQRKELQTAVKGKK